MENQFGHRKPELGHEVQEKVKLGVISAQTVTAITRREEVAWWESAGGEGAGPCDVCLGGRAGPQGGALDHVGRKPGVLGPSGQGKCAFPESTDHSQPGEAAFPEP